MSVDVVGGDKKEGWLRAVIFNPSKSVTYRPIPSKQMAEINIINNEKTPIIFKWKSTRPGMYKMRPVFGVLNVGEKVAIQLFCKGIKDSPPLNDRYTCVLAASPSANVNAENVWSNHKYQQKLAQSGKLRKVKLSVLYQGVNDQEQKDEETEEDEKDRVGKMQKKKKEDEKNKTLPVVKKEPPGRKRPTIVMFTRKECESASGEEDDGVDPVVKNGTTESEDGLKTIRPTAGTFSNTVQPNAAPAGAGAGAAAAAAASVSTAPAPSAEGELKTPKKIPKVFSNTVIANPKAGPSSK